MAKLVVVFRNFANAWELYTDLRLTSFGNIFYDRLISD